MKHVEITNEFDARHAAIAIAYNACRDGRGHNRAGGDPVHEHVTEGRRTQWEQARARGAAWAQRGTYSSCGDLAHYMLYALGCRDSRYVNRDELAGWRVGANISMLCSSPWFLSDGAPKVGDILYVTGPEHVCVLLSRVSDDKWITADYGQPYACVHHAHVQRVPGAGVFVRKRPLRGFVSIAKVPLVAPACVPDVFYLRGDEDET